MSVPESTVPPEASAPRCPRCQAALSADAPAGLCPACLVSAHFGTEAEATEPATTAPAPSLDDIAPHFPQLEILACLGRGGMGVVYRARQKSLGRLVALKLLAPERGSDPAFAERFAREAQALARLDHPHIVTIHDFGQAGGYFYLLMEYVDGVTLRQLVQGGRIAAREALAIVPQICDALQFAHDHGVVHRDIKPENILLDRKGQVKVADFGLAKLVGPGEVPLGAEGVAAAGASADITIAGHVMGTPRYMAPEQRERPTEVDHRADIYALGVVLYQMLTGDLPGEKQFDPPSRRVRVDVRLDEIVLRALERDPERRYSSATEFKTRIETFATEPPPVSGSQTGGVPPPPIAADPHRVELEKIKPAATALIVTSALDLAGLVFGLIVGAGVLFLLPFAGAATGAFSSPQFNFFGNPLHLVGALVWFGVAAVVLWIAINVAANIFVITSASRMMKGLSPRRARAGAITAIVLGVLGLITTASQPAGWLLSLWSILQLASGVWALVLLQKPEAAAAFKADSQTPEKQPGGTTQTGMGGSLAASAPGPDPVASVDVTSLERVRRSVSVPATGLVATAAMHLLLLALLVIIAVARYIEEGPQWLVEIVLPILALLLVLVLGAISVFTLVSAVRMRRLRGRGAAICAAVLAIVTLQGVILGPIFGIWALVVLSRREVSRSFEDGRPGGGGRGCQYGVVALLIVAAILAAGVAAVAMFVYFKPRAMAHGFGGLPGIPFTAPAIAVPAQTAPAVDARPDFDPFVRVERLEFDGDGNTPLLDLENQRIVLPGNEAAQAYDKRMNVTGVYFHHDRASNQLTFTGLSVGMFNLDHRGGDQWKGLPPRALRDPVGGATGTRSSTSIVAKPGETGTHVYVFKTRTGASGLLRTTGITRDPHSISIEWKFFSDALPVLEKAVPAADELPVTEQPKAGKPPIDEVDAEADGGAAALAELEGRLEVASTISSWEFRDKVLAEVSR